MLWLLGCTHTPPDAFRDQVRALELAVPADQIERAVAMAAASGVHPVSTPDLTGSWAIQRATYGNGGSMEGPVERKQLSPGVVSFAIVTVNAIDGKPIAALAARGIEVFGTDRLCILWLDAEQTFNDGSEAAHSLVEWSSVEKMNEVPCANEVLELTATRAVFRFGELTYEEHRTR